MKLLRKILSPLYRNLIAKLWQAPFLYNFLLTQREAIQLKLSKYESKKIIKKFRQNNKFFYTVNSNFKWAIKCPVPEGELGKTWGDFYFAQEVANALLKKNRQVRIDTKNNFNNLHMSNDDVVLVIRGLEPFRPQNGVINILWVISHPELVSKKELLSYDLVFAASTYWANKMTNKTGKQIFPLLQATNPEVFNPRSAQPDSKPGIIFIGNSRNKYRKIIKDSISLKLPIRIIGKNWEKFVPKKFIQTNFIENNKISAEYRASTIVLNDHWPSMRKNGFISNRLFDAVASGARVISDDIQGMEEIFGKSVRTYSNKTNLKNLVSADPDLVFGTREMLDAQANLIGQNHNFDQRAAVLIEKVQELAQKNG